MPFGATIVPEGARFRLWAPAARSVDLGLGADARALTWHALAGETDGWYHGIAPGAGAGTRYRFRIDGETLVPDPASRYNPDDVHGASQVIDPLAFEWHDSDWRGRAWNEAVVYELHVGTLTQEGTFAGVAARLDYLVDVGITALELMPLADFPGRRNWGYDGALPFAPDATYGHPEDLKALVAAAHRRGLMVILDVVYNHFGPEGNYLHLYAPQFFTERHPTPWGAGINFDGEQSRVVRDFFLHNALYWLEEFNVDGLRLDAVHAIADDSTPDILTELAEKVRAGPGRERMVHLVLENDRNEARRLARDRSGRPLHFTAQWNDDLHHVLHGILTREQNGYYGDYTDAPVQLLGRCLAEGFAYQGEPSRWRAGRPRGETSALLPPAAFVSFLQNHDQVGNRARGERLHALARADALRAALAIVLLAPAPPLVFMGEEFAAATPFLFFCDFEPELAAAVTRGRRAEFASFASSSDSRGAARIPDPAARETFERSKLDWRSVEHAPHAECLALYRTLLELRRAEIVPLENLISCEGRSWRTFADHGLTVSWPLVDGRALMLYANLGPSDARWRAGRSPATHVIYASPGFVENDGVLRPWSVAWRLENARNVPEP
ncbi:MAG: malto-oligosyltrehalose trehalohydrolase [Burkholderiales bacterium]